MKHVLLITILLAFLAGCASGSPALPPIKPPVDSAPAAQAPSPRGVPAFDHIILIVLENQEYQAIRNNADMPYLNDLAQKNVLLTQYYAVAHPSLPNYLAMIGGDTFGIHTDCNDCFLPNPSLPDRLEAGGKTWRAYLEDMPQPCQLGFKGKYAQKHNPFVYFNPIRESKQRCDSSVVPMAQLEPDMDGGPLPNFVYINPNMCNSGHDCPLKTTDDWLKRTMTMLEKDKSLRQNSLVIITFDESEGSNAACCGLDQGGGQVFTVLVSADAKPAFQDASPYNHYSMLKTILQAWNLPDLGHTADAGVKPFLAPWQE